MWSKKVILQELRAQNAYNNAPPYGLRGFLGDWTNRIIGYGIIRQIRSKRYNCEPPTPLNEVIDTCSGNRGLVNEDSKDFCAGWNYNDSFPGACEMEEFKYQSADELRTFTMTGKLGMYGGGGYVIRLTGRQNDILKRLDLLQRNHWIDGNTKAVILEFSIYNANVNLFATCMINAEFNDGGGVLPKWKFDPIRLIKTTDFFASIVTACELLFVIITIIMTINELWKIKKEKLSYFLGYWNIGEMLLIIIAYVSIGLYIYRTTLTKEALEIFNTTFGNGYVRMDSSAYVDSYYMYCVAAIIFFSTLKLIKLLQFNKRMNVLSLTIGLCWDELKVFLVAFAIIFFAFACLFYFIFHTKLETFANILSAMQTSFKMMMGKFDFEAMNRANSLSPILFFVFSVMNSMILINIMLTIILQAFNEIKMGLLTQDNRLNVIDYIWDSFLIFIRQQNLKRSHVKPILEDKNDSVLRDPNSQQSEVLPEKVSFVYETFLIFSHINM